MSDFLDDDLMPLRHFTWIMEHRERLTTAAHVQIPSPAIEDRTDHVVIIFPRARSYSAAGLIVRNKGTYSDTKSAQLAARLSALLGEMELAPPGKPNSYEEGKPYYEGTAEPEGVWTYFEEHRTAPRLLGEAEKAVREATPAPVKTVKLRVKASGKNKSKGRKSKRGKR